MNKEQQELLDEAYRSYSKSHWSPPSNPNGKLLSDQLWSLKPMEHSKESFINKCKTDTEFSERWGLKIEERELSLEERLEIADKFNPLIREDCLTKTHHPDETEELKLIYRHEWLDSLGPNVVPQRKLITVLYNNKTIESYE